MYESERSCMKLDSPKGLEVDGLRKWTSQNLNVVGPEVTNWTTFKIKVDGPKG